MDIGRNKLTDRCCHGRFKCLLWAVAAAMVCLLWASLSSAYILPGPFVLQLLARNLAGAQSLHVQQRVVIDDPAVSDGPVELSEELSYLFPGRFRSEILHQDSRRVHVVSQGESITIVDNRIAPGGEGRFDRYKDLLLYHSGDMIHQTLLSHGVDVGIVSLGRMGDHLVFVIGAQYPDESVSQLWIDKDRLVPLRWINVFPPNRTTGQKERLDFVYKDWRKFDGAWYPMQIESFLNQRKIRTINAAKVETNVVIPGELVNIQHLVSVYGTPDDGGARNEPPVDAVDEVEQTIEDFRKKFEP